MTRRFKVRGRTEAEVEQFRLAGYSGAILRMPLTR